MCSYKFRKIYNKTPASESLFDKLQSNFRTTASEDLKFMTRFPVDTGRKLNVQKMFRRRPRRLLNVLCTFNLRPVSMGLAVLHN